MIQVRTTRWPDERPGGEWRTRIRLPIDELNSAWAQFFGRIPWAAMVTLTFDLKRVFPVRQARANRDAWWWCCSLGKMFRRPVAWLYVTERGRSGAWHVHALVAGLSVAEVDRAADMWRVGRGLADVREVWEGEGAVLYVSKEVPCGAEVVFSETMDIYRDRLRPQTTVQLLEGACPGPGGGGIDVPDLRDGTNSRLDISSRDHEDAHGGTHESGSRPDPHYQELLSQLFEGYFRELRQGRRGHDQRRTKLSDAS